MASGTIDLTVTEIQNNSYTANTSTTEWSWSSANVIKSGKVRTLCFGATIKSSSSNYVSIGTIANAVDYPVADIRGLCIEETGAHAKLFGITSAGVVQIYQPVGGKTYWGQTTWLVY